MKRILPLLAIAGLLLAGCRLQERRARRPHPAALGRGVARPGQGPAGASEKYDKARPYFTHAFEVEPNSTIGREALLLAADTYYLQGGTANYIQAEAKYRDFLNRFPTSEQSAYVQFQIANSLAKRMEKPDRDQNVTRKAMEAYQELIRALSDERVRGAGPGADAGRAAPTSPSTSSSSAASTLRFGAAAAAIAVRVDAQQLPAVQGAGQGDVQPRPRLHGRAACRTTPTRPSTCCAPSSRRAPTSRRSPTSKPPRPLNPAKPRPKREPEPQQDNEALQHHPLSLPPPSVPRRRRLCRRRPCVRTIPSSRRSRRSRRAWSSCSASRP